MSKSSKSFECKKCNYSAKLKTNYEKHLTSNKHKGIVKEIKEKREEDGYFHCEPCQHKTADITNFRTHCKSKKHLNGGCESIGKMYECKWCKYQTRVKRAFDNHNLTGKHIKNKGVFTKEDFRWVSAYNKVSKYLKNYKKQFIKHAQDIFEELDKERFHQSLIQKDKKGKIIAIIEDNGENEISEYSHSKFTELKNKMLSEGIDKVEKEEFIKICERLTWTFYPKGKMQELDEETKQQFKEARARFKKEQQIYLKD